MNALITLIANAQPTLKTGYTLAVAHKAHGDSLVEIRNEHGLVWRDWTFSDSFEADLAKEIAYASEVKQPTAMDNATAQRIADLKETIGFIKADLAACTTRKQVQDLYKLIDSREAELKELEAPEVLADTEQAFVNRCVNALDLKQSPDVHNVYIHWFRINHGCWVDAVEVVNAGGLADYLKSIGLNESDVAELMTQDWDCQDAKGLALKCLGNWGSFDWKLMGELLEAAEECEVDVLSAGLAIGIPANQVAEKHQGQWDNAEDYAYDYWESCGLLADVPESARNYLNWEAIARDMLLNGDVVESNKHYFHTC